MISNKKHASAIMDTSPQGKTFPPGKKKIRGKKKKGLSSVGNKLHGVINLELWFLPQVHVVSLLLGFSASSIIS